MSEPVDFVSLGVIDGVARQRSRVLTAPEPARLPLSSDGRPGRIDIELPSGARLSVDAGVDERALSRVLRAVRDAL